MPNEDDKEGKGVYPVRPEPGGWYHLMPGDTPDVVMARIDERTKNTQEKVGELKRAVDDLEKSVNTNYVSQEAFKALVARVDLLQKIIFGVIGIVGITIVGALLKLVFIDGVVGK